MKKPSYVSIPTYIAVLETRIKALEKQVVDLSHANWPCDKYANHWLKKWPEIKLKAYPAKGRKKK